IANATAVCLLRRIKVDGTPASGAAFVRRLGRSLSSSHPWKDLMEPRTVRLVSRREVVQERTASYVGARRYRQEKADEDAESRQWQEDAGKGRTPSGGLRTGVEVHARDVIPDTVRAGDAAE